ncbi:MAG: hypothetical protein ACYSUB_01815 [Planctomycetota bacterium]|jgi:hypothetical protein
MAYFDENLVRQVRACGDGASVHTRNKVICYYCWLKTSSKVRKELETMMQKALNTSDWKPLRIRMRKWF